MNRIEQWAKQKGLINEVQGAMVDNCSSLHTAWVVKEAICNNTEQDKTTYVGLLDIQKCFDCLWQDGIFMKLHKSIDLDELYPTRRRVATRRQAALPA